MITPQQIDQISFSQTRHGYDMEQGRQILHFRRLPSFLK